MTVTVPAQQTGPVRLARPRQYLMCRPDYFDVVYAINPWMDPSRPVDTARAVAQWEGLRQAYLDLGHTVHLIDAAPGLPDMVYAANGGTVVGGRTLAARFAYAERQPEGELYAARLAELGPVERPVGITEGEGDFLLVGDLLLAGTGFRTERSTHAQAQELFGVPVVSLSLVDPCYYHLDTALAVLDHRTIAYYPDAFSPGSQAVLRRLFPDAILASGADAAVLGLNAVSDGRHVVLAAEAVELAAALAARGFVPVPVELSELRLGGGGVKCCTLELRT